MSLFRVILFFLSLAPILAAAETPAQTVLKSQQAWIDSYNHQDAQALAEIEADDFRIVLGDGSVQAKADQLNNIRRQLPR